MAVNFYLDNRPDKNGDHPIRISITVCGTRFITSTGYNTAPDKWDKTRQEIKRGYANGKGITYNVINAHLKRITGYFADLENRAIHNEETVSREDLREAYALKFGKGDRLVTALKSKAEKSFFDHVDEFTSEMGKASQWTTSTFEKFSSVKNHLLTYNPNLKFSDFNEDGLVGYMCFLRDVKMMRNTTIGKQLGFLKWFLRWATTKGYNNELAFATFSPKLKSSEKKVIFLDWNELMKVYNYEIPDNGTIVKLIDSNGKKYDKVVHDSSALKKTRDVFCFCCFTSLRYSDVANLRRSNVFDDYISITTVKTADSLKIELNNYSIAILNQYVDEIFPNDLALPVISNQRMNEYLKELCELCGINKAITITYYRGNERFDEVYPKYALISTHAGRRTFICNALMLGAAPQVVMKWTGHSDYKAMKPYIDITDTAKAETMKLFNK